MPLALRPAQLGGAGAADRAAGGAVLVMAAAGRVPTAAQNLLPAAPAEPQAQLVLTVATAVTVVVAISVTFFLLGLWCGWMWRRRQGRRH
jgi:heme/copper-type cytochrome/quinol oxidase subunit 2